MSHRQTPSENEGPTAGLNTASAIRIDAPRLESEVISFGPFRLFCAARALEKNAAPLALGDRALDLLMVLVEHAGEVVSHRELLTRVWRGLVVDPSNLRVHINALRKALGDREGEARYIANVTGQGYCFVAPVQREATSDSPPLPPGYPCRSARQRLSLPPLLERMVGHPCVTRAWPGRCAGARRCLVSFATAGRNAYLSDADRRFSRIVGDCRRAAVGGAAQRGFALSDAGGLDARRLRTLHGQSGRRA